jgi:hypothetical protein
MEAVEWFQAFHRVACQKLGIDPDSRGARSRVAEVLQITPQQYGDALRGHRGSRETLKMWAERLGLVLETVDGKIHTLLPGVSMNTQAAGPDPGGPFRPLSFREGLLGIAAAVPVVGDPKHPVGFPARLELGGVVMAANLRRKTPWNASPSAKVRDTKLLVWVREAHRIGVWQRPVEMSFADLFDALPPWLRPHVRYADMAELEVDVWAAISAIEQKALVGTSFQFAMMGSHIKGELQRTGPHTLEWSLQFLPPIVDWVRSLFGPDTP